MPDTPTAPKPPGPRTLEFTLTGMTTAGCARRIERSLLRIDGVTAHVDYAHRSATTTFDPERVTTEALIAAVRAAGYDASVRRTATDAAVAAAVTGDRDERTRLLMRNRSVAALAAATVVLPLGTVPGLAFGGWQWVSLAISAPIVTWAAWPLHVSGARALRSARANVDTLASIGILAAFAFSLGALIFGDAGADQMRHGFAFSPDRSAGFDHVSFDVATLVAAILLCARYIEVRGRHKAGRLISAMLATRAEQAQLLIPGRAEPTAVAAQTLRPGDAVLVAPGALIPADAIVIDGDSGVDESLLTGEAAPVDKRAGDHVTGATRNTHGELLLRITATGDETVLASITRLVRSAQQAQGQTARLADRIATILAPAVFVVAVATIGGRLLLGESLTSSLAAATAVLIVATPCALGLVTPSALLVAARRGAALGLLIHGPQALESSRDVDVVLLDKTGTLTTGQMEVEEIITAEGISAPQTLRLAGAVESASDHLVAQAIARAATAGVGHLPPARGFQHFGGLGAAATVADRVVTVGQLSLLTARGHTCPPVLQSALLTAERRGRTAIAAGWYGEVRAVIVLTDPPKPSATDAVRRLKALGLRPVLVTGDNRHAALTVAEQVGIARSDVRAEMLPAGKSEAVIEMQREGHIVAAAGDGINDAPALATADLGIAIGTGTDIAVAAGDITVLSGDPCGIADAIELSRRTLRTIKQGLAVAITLTAVSLPPAVLGLMSPLLASVILAASSGLVLLSALRLAAFRPSR